MNAGAAPPGKAYGPIPLPLHREDRANAVGLGRRSWVTYLFPRAEKLLDGEPRIVIRDGELLEDNLRRDRVTRAEVESEMRLAGISAMRDVAWAILEPQGKMSFIRRTES